jgi:oligoribonuclease NrnB/cAMP/cGMP phosphodiesterase (DHH superfamily)
MEITKDIVVVYHGMCRDGFTAAWAAWKKFGDSAEYIPVVWTNQSEQVPSLKDKDVYFLDYCPLQEKLDHVVKDNKSVHVIDHHVSRETVIKSLPDSVYDINHSGAVLAWKYFHPGKPVPQICLYVEDSDIWNWKIPHSADVLSLIDLQGDYDFQTWDSIAADLEDPARRAVYEEKGNLLSLFRQRVVSGIIREHVELVNFEGYEVYAVNGPRFFKSEIGNELAKAKPPFGIVWSYTTDEISVSLRAIKGEFDLIPIAAKYGGGGHKAAANFRLPLGAPLPWKILNKKSDETHD